MGELLTWMWDGQKRVLKALLPDPYRIEIEKQRGPADEEKWEVFTVVNNRIAGEYFECLHDAMNYAQRFYTQARQAEAKEGGER